MVLRRLAGLFGLVAGYTVTKLGHIKRLAKTPLSMRLGVESPGLNLPHDGDEHKQ